MKADSSLKKSDQLMSWYSAKMKNSKDSLLKQYSSKVSSLPPELVPVLIRQERSAMTLSR